MVDFVEMPGGGFKKRIDKHTRGEKSSPKKVDKKINNILKSQYIKRKEEEFLEQDLGSGAKKAQTVSENLGVGSEDYQKRSGAHSAGPLPGKGEPRERVAPEEKPRPFSLRDDLNVRNQPEPGRFNATNKPRRPTK